MQLEGRTGTQSLTQYDDSAVRQDLSPMKPGGVATVTPSPLRVPRLPPLHPLPLSSPSALARPRPHASRIQTATAAPNFRALVSKKEDLSTPGLRAPCYAISFGAGGGRRQSRRSPSHLRSLRSQHRRPAPAAVAAVSISPESGIYWYDPLQDCMPHMAIVTAIGRADSRPEASASVPLWIVPVF